MEKYHCWSAMKVFQIHHKWGVYITTLLPLKCGVKKQKEHLLKRRKDWVLVQFTAFNPCFLKKIKWYIDLIMVL